MGIAQRIESTIEDWQAKWKDLLRGWLLRTIGEGVIKFTEALEPGMIDTMRDTLTKVIENPSLPDDLRASTEKALGEGDFMRVLWGYMVMTIQAIPALIGSSQPLANVIRYELDKQVKSFRLDPAAVITAWRRDPEKYTSLFDDLKDQGWSDERLEALKFYSLFYPSPRDLIGFLAHEVYEDDMARKYGLDADFGEVVKHLDKFEKAGMKEEQVREFWRDHWEHTSYLQMVEMLHRGLLTETGQPPPTTKEGWVTRDAEGTEILRDWYKLVEMADFWRDKLTAMSWNVPTRVDVRRWWDMRTISEEELRNVYHRQGYHGTDLDNYVLWTKVYTAFPDLIARMTKGWITPEEVGKELERLGMPPDRVKEMLETKIKPEEAAVVEEERQLTVTDIIMWLKKYPDEEEHAIELIMDLGYSRTAAEFKIDARIAAEAGSPETYEEFKAITNKYRIATGREEKPMPEELKRAGTEVVRLTGELEALEESIRKESETLIPGEVLPEATTRKLKKLQVTKNRAISELERVKSEYDRLVAEWKHSLP